MPGRPRAASMGPVTTATNDRTIPTDSHTTVDYTALTNHPDPYCQLLDSGKETTAGLEIMVLKSTI